MTNLLGRRRGSRWRFGTKTAKNFRGRLISIGNKPYIDPPVDEVDDGNDPGGAGSIRSQCSKIRKKCNFKSTKTHYLHFQKW